MTSRAWMPMEPVDENKQELVDAYMRVIKDLFEDYSYYAPKMPKELVINIIGSDDPIYLTEYLTQNLGFPLESKQQILEESNVRKRLELLSTLLHRESEVLKIEHSIAERVKDQVDRNQKEYYLREQLKAIHAELGDDDDPDQEIAQYYEKLRAMNPDEETRQKLSDEINKLSKMMYSSQEAVSRTVALPTLNTRYGSQPRASHKLKNSWVPKLLSSTWWVQRLIRGFLSS